MVGQGARPRSDGYGALRHDAGALMTFSPLVSPRFVSCRVVSCQLLLNAASRSRSRPNEVMLRICSRLLSVSRPPFSHPYARRRGSLRSAGTSPCLLPTIAAVSRQLDALVGRTTGCEPVGRALTLPCTHLWSGGLLHCFTAPAFAAAAAHRRLE
jgi:hypothetical protein